MPNKLLGQNFLENHEIILKIVDAVDITKDDFIIEVGSGRGVLTEALYEHTSNLGAKFIAIEKDSQLALKLLKHFSDNLSIISGDILDELPKYLSDDFFKTEKHFKLVGNLPYYLTGHLLRIISEAKHFPETCVFMLQEEVVDRIMAKAGSMNRLAASVRYWAEPKLIMKVSREEFTPKPNVDSAILTLKRRSSPEFPDASRYFKAVRTLFSQPRKTILNNISAEFQETISKSVIFDRLEAIGINPLDRPQDLEFFMITKVTADFF